MLRFALRGLAARKLRSILTGVSIMLGAAMIAGTLILTNQITGAFDDIFAKANQGTDVILTQKTEFDSQQQQAGPLPESLVATVQKVPGVAVAEGQVGALGSLVVDGKYLAPTGGPPLVFSVPSDRFNSNTLEEGRFPSARGEVAVERGTADRENLKVGQAAGLTTRVGVRPVTISGIFRFADAGTIGGATLTAITLADAQAWYDREGQVSTIIVAAEPGVGAEDLAARIQAAVPPTVLVETGAVNATRSADTINDQLSFLPNTLYVFAVIALLVGAFIIFNVFSITVAQRIRELAMLRTVGASRRQLLTSVLAEAGIVGLIASIVGVAAGVLFAKGLLALFDAAGFGLPARGIQLTFWTVATPIIVGTLVTLLAALIPALRATRIAPVAALREGATLPTSRFTRLAPVIGVLLGLAGIVFIALGFTSDGTLRTRLFLIGGGGLLILFGVGILMRFAVRPLARLMGWPLEKVGGNSARLGRENATRNPARTATTAAALMVGVGLVVFVSVFVAGFKSSIADSIDRTLKSDLVTIDDGFLLLPAGAVEATRAVPEVESALGVAIAVVKIDGGATAVMNAVDPEESARIVAFQWERDGDDALLGQLGSDGALVEREFAKTHGVRPGATFTATTVDGTTKTFKVLGEYRDPQLFTGFLTSRAIYDALVPDPDVQFILTALKEGVTPDAGAAAVSAALKTSYPAAKVRTNKDHKKFINQQLNIILSLFYALLAFSVLISLFGVLITLLLAVYERTREIGMMRAIGTTRDQMRAIIRSESVITCAIGGLVGIAVGLLFGWLIAKGLESEGIQFTVPYITIGVVFVLAVLAGLLASLAPARRAAKLQPLEALHYE